MNRVRGHLEQEEPDGRYRTVGMKEPFRSHQERKKDKAPTYNNAQRPATRLFGQPQGMCMLHTADG